MRRFLLLASALCFAAVSGAPAASAAPCRDKGKFVKCAPAPAKKCRDANGKFSKCAPGL